MEPKTMIIMRGEDVTLQELGVCLPDFSALWPHHIIAFNNSAIYSSSNGHGTRVLVIHDTESEATQIVDFDELGFFQQPFDGCIH